MKLEQKGKFKTTTYNLSKSGLYISEKTINNYSENTIPYENIGQRIHSHRGYNSDFLLVSGICVGATFLILLMYYFDTKHEIDVELSLISFIFSLGFFVAYRFSKKSLKEIELIDIKPCSLFVHADKPDEESVNKFISEMLKNSKEYMRNKYAYIDQDLSEESNITRLRYLLDHDIISQIEFDELKSQLKMGI